MADPKGFLTTRDREVPARRSIPLRVKDWKEVYEPGDPAALARQAGRCMDCGVPFCHQGCPLGNLIPEWNDLVWRDDFEGAIERLHATNNFPEFTGRICPAPCESACVLGINQPAVTIKQVEVSVIDHAMANGGLTPHVPQRLTEKTVAVDNGLPARTADYATNVPGVFVAGDAGRGASLVVWAIAEGRAVAAEVDTYLTGSTVLPAPVRATDRPFAI